jgi:hypothetical protein
LCPIVVSFLALDFLDLFIYLFLFLMACSLQLLYICLIWPKAVAWGNYPDVVYEKSTLHLERLMLSVTSVRYYSREDTKPGLPLSLAFGSRYLAAFRFTLRHITSVPIRQPCPSNQLRKSAEDRSPTRQVYEVYITCQSKCNSTLSLLSMIP